MHQINKKALGKGTWQCEVIIGWDEIEKEYQKAQEKLIKNIEIPGFRKGKAPLEIARKKIKEEMIVEELIKELIPQLYQEILQKENLQPAVEPKIILEKAKKEENWVIKFVIAEKPKIKIADYRKIAQKIKGEEKAAQIWVPGKEEKKDDKENEEKRKLEKLNKILNKLIEETEIEISDLIVEKELTKRLSQLLDDIRRIGLTVESYLQAKNEKIEDIKEKFKKEIIDFYKLELALEEIAEKEKISVSQQEIENLLANIKDEKERNEARKNAYFYAAFLRRQKTIDFLTNL